MTEERKIEEMLLKEIEYGAKRGTEIEAIKMEFESIWRQIAGWNQRQADYQEQVGRELSYLKFSINDLQNQLNIAREEND